MNDLNPLSKEQTEIRKKIFNGAIIWAVIAGLSVAGLSYWFLSGQTGIIQISGALATGASVGFFAFRKSIQSGERSAKCEKCNASFSISKTDTHKKLVDSQTKEKREAQDDGTEKRVTWIEETYDVTDTFSCAKCADTTVKTYQTHVKQDEKETIIQLKSSGKKQGISKDKAHKKDDEKSK